MSRIDARALRAAFGSFLTGVTVVTTRAPDGTPHGFTANSFSSVSLDPPLLLVCPGRLLSSFTIFESCRDFAISILAEGQEHVSNIFASYKGDRFTQVEWEPDAQGVPLITGAAATFSCQTSQIVPAGDHIVMVGEIVGFHYTQALGLGYASGQYFSLGLEREAAAAPMPGHSLVTGAIIEHDDKVLLEQTPDGLRPPQLELEGRPQVRNSLAQYLSSAGIEAELGKAYSIFYDGNLGVHHTYFRARAASDVTGMLGRYFPIADLTTQRFASDAQAAMLARYALEHEAQNFALYVGDESGGDIHGSNDRN